MVRNNIFSAVKNQIRASLSVKNSNSVRADDDQSTVTTRRVADELVGVGLLGDV